MLHRPGVQGSFAYPSPFTTTDGAGVPSISLAAVFLGGVPAAAGGGDQRVVQAAPQPLDGLGDRSHALGQYQIGVQWPTS